MSPDRILVVDDSGTIRRVVDNALASAGFRVDVAKNGELGLEKARQDRPDLLLLDFRMPGLNGFEVGKEIARDKDLSGIPILLMCTRTDRLPDHDLASIGVVSTLIKPFSPEALVDRVRHTLNDVKTGTFAKPSVDTLTRNESRESFAPRFNDDNSTAQSDVFAEAALPIRVPAPKVPTSAPTAPSEFSLLKPEKTNHAMPPGPPPVTDEGDHVDSEAIMSAIDVPSEHDDGPAAFPPLSPDAPNSSLINTEEFATVAARAVEEDLHQSLVDAFDSRGISSASSLATSILEQVKDKLAPSVMLEFVRRELPKEALRRPIPALFGDLTEVPLPEVLQLLKFQGQTGVLEVVLEQMRFEATFHEGRIHTIQGVNVKAVHRLGRYFVRTGAVSEEQLETALKDNSMSIGARLLEDGLISEEDLRAAVRAQVEDLMFEMLRCRRGMFGLRREPIDEDLPFAGFSVDALLFEGLRRIDERSVIGQEVPSVDSVFILGKNASPDGLSVEELRALEALDPKTPIAVHTLANELDLSVDDAMMLIYRLVMLGRARRVRRPGEPAVGPPPRPPSPTIPPSDEDFFL